MSRKRVLLVGTSFAGFTGTTELKEHLGDAHDVIVLAPSPEFVFIPSLIWVPFGLRNKEYITFEVRSPYEKKGIQYIQGSAIFFDMEKKVVHSTRGDIPEFPPLDGSQID